MSREKTKTFEESMARLEEIVDLLQENEQPLDETIKLFEEGLKLVRVCEGKLKEVETKVAELSEESEEN